MAQLDGDGLKHRSARHDGEMQKAGVGRRAATVLRSGEEKQDGRGPAVVSSFVFGTPGRLDGDGLRRALDSLAAELERRGVFCSGEHDERRSASTSDGGELGWGRGVFGSCLGDRLQQIGAGTG
jgi:hypothetical protein